MLKIVTVVVKFKISRSRNKVLLWQEPLPGSAGGSAGPGPEAALPAVVGRRCIHRCELFVAPWGARHSAPGHELGRQSGNLLVLVRLSASVQSTKRLMGERAHAESLRSETRNVLLFSPPCRALEGSAQQPSRRSGLAAALEPDGRPTLVNPVCAACWQGLLSKLTEFYD